METRAATRSDVLTAIERGRLKVQMNGEILYRRPGDRAAWRVAVGDVVRGPHQRTGYRRIGFTVEGVRFRVLVHRAVVWAYGLNITKGFFVNHKNGNKLDNRISNIEVVTASENIKHAVETGLNTAARGRDSGPAKRARLDDDQVRAIRDDERTQNKIANDFGIGPDMVSRIKSGKRYAWVD